MKLGWRLVTQRDALWVKVIRDKYKCGEDLLPRINAKRSGSNVWTGIKKTWELVRGGITTNPDNNLVIWKWERHGTFTVRSAYQALTGDEQEEEQDWSGLWKVKAPLRCKTLLWLASRQCLLTNASRRRRTMTMDASCPLCGGDYEDTIHVLRECTHSKAIWRIIVPQARWSRFWNLSISEWIWRNIGGKSEGSRKWASTFTVLCWWLWRRRNLLVFENKWISNKSLIASSRAIVDCMQHTIDRLAGTRIQGATLAPSRESWRPLEEDWVKLNVDGAFSAVTRQNACGGLLRDSSGNFIKGFTYFINNGDALSAEIWACLLGLRMAWAMGVRKVWLETDSIECIDLILHGHGPSHYDAGLITEVTQLLEKEWVTKITYVPRSCNNAADYLAKTGLAGGFGYHEIYQPSKDLHVLMCQDCNRCQSVLGVS